MSEARPSVAGTRAAPLPGFVAPQLATLVKAPPARRRLAARDEVRRLPDPVPARAPARDALSRNGKDWTAQFPEIADAVAACPSARRSSTARSPPCCRTARRASRRCRTRSRAARQAASSTSSSISCTSTARISRGAPLEDRKARAGAVLGPGARRLAPLLGHVVGGGRGVLRAGVPARSRRDHLEAPRPALRARAGPRLAEGQVRPAAGVRGRRLHRARGRPYGAWRAPPRRLRRRRAARVRRARSAPASRESLGPRSSRERLDRIRVADSPIRHRPPGACGARWVEARARGRGRPSPSGPGTGGCGIRRSRGSARTSPPGRSCASAAGLSAPRHAAEPGEARGSQHGRRRRGPERRRRRPAKSSWPASGSRHPDRVVYPGSGRDEGGVRALLRGDRRVGSCPHSPIGRAVLVRCPEGLGGSCFYQKHAGPWAPASLRRIRIREKTKNREYLVVEDVAGLMGLVQMGVLEIHTWNAHARRARDARPAGRSTSIPDPASPGRPSSSPPASCVRSLETAGLTSFVKTTGGKGLHVVAPIRPEHGWDECLDFARAGSPRPWWRETPGAFTATMAKAARQGEDLPRLLPQPARRDLRRGLLDPGATGRPGRRRRSPGTSSTRSPGPTTSPSPASRAAWHGCAPIPGRGTRRSRRPCPPRGASGRRRAAPVRGARVAARAAGRMSVAPADEHNGDGAQAGALPHRT